MSESLGGILFMKNKHMSLEDRCKIEKGLNNNDSFKSIAEEISKNCTTISREIRNHYTTQNKGAYGRKFNDCLNRKNCPFRYKCDLNICDSYHAIATDKYSFRCT